MCEDEEPVDDEGGEDAPRFQQRSGREGGGKCRDEGELPEEDENPRGPTRGRANGQATHVEGEEGPRATSRRALGATHATRHWYQLVQLIFAIQCLHTSFDFPILRIRNCSIYN